ncbi:MAG TPA: copper transporter [Acidimicrobiales bacterium]|nr:copper transporter [Acidimicrobiales bacterium]
MLSFRYHVVSLVAVFLALSIGVIVGTTVIDRALVDRLEDQQRILRDDIDDARDTNRALSDEMDELRERSDRLASEGGERLVAGTLDDVPVLVIAVRGLEGEVHDDLMELVGAAGADVRGTVWLSARFALDDADDATAIAGVLGERAELPRGVLRNLAVIRLAAELRGAAAEEEVTGEGGDEDTAVDADAGAGEEGPPPGGSLLDELVATGFAEIDLGAEVAADEALVRPGTRVVVLSGVAAMVDDEVLGRRLALELVVTGRAEPPMGVVAVEPAAPTPEEDEPDDEVEEGEAFVEGLRAAGNLATRLSTVDNLDEFSGRLATILALEDLGLGVTGHYGTRPDATRLFPAPPSTSPNDEG